MVDLIIAVSIFRVFIVLHETDMKNLRRKTNIILLVLAMLLGSFCASFAQPGPTGPHTFRAIVRGSNTAPLPNIEFYVIKDGEITPNPLISDKDGYIEYELKGADANKKMEFKLRENDKYTTDDVHLIKIDGGATGKPRIIELDGESVEYFSIKILATI